jgi:hypothetical protein
MEIYSPRSKNKELFKKNQLKMKQVVEDKPEAPQFDDKPFFKPVEVVTNRENFIIKAGKVVSERLKIFFELNETV